MPQSKVYTVLALLLMLNCAYGLFNFQIFADDAYPNKCVVDGKEDNRLIIDSGKSEKHPDKCVLVECHRNGWALVYECERPAPPINCKYTDLKDPNAPYPQCCEMDIMCNDISWD